VLCLSFKPNTDSFIRSIYNINMFMYVDCLCRLECVLIWCSVLSVCFVWSMFWFDVLCWLFVSVGVCSDLMFCVDCLCRLKYVLIWCSMLSVCFVWSMFWFDVLCWLFVSVWSVIWFDVLCWLFVSVGVCSDLMFCVKCLCRLKCVLIWCSVLIVSLVDCNFLSTNCVAKWRFTERDSNLWLLKTIHATAPIERNVNNPHVHTAIHNPTVEDVSAFCGAFWTKAAKNHNKRTYSFLIIHDEVDSNYIQRKHKPCA